MAFPHKHETFFDHDHPSALGHTPSRLFPSLLLPPCLLVISFLISCSVFQALLHPDEKKETRFAFRVCLVLLNIMSSSVYFSALFILNEIPWCQFSLWLSKLLCIFMSWLPSHSCVDRKLDGFQEFWAMQWVCRHHSGKTALIPVCTS